MKINVLLILSSMITLGYGQGISFYKSKANNLIISSKSCDDVLRQQEAICSWKEKIDPSFNSNAFTKNKCHRNSRGKYYLNVSRCLPKFVKENHQKKLYKTGTNCWGTAMGLNGLSLKPRYVWAEEMTYWQNSPLCKKLEVGERKKPGDIINTYGPEHMFDRNEWTKGSDFWSALFPGRATEAPVKRGYSGFHHFLHSETYVSDELGFGKDSPHELDRFGFHHMSEVYGRGLDKDCHENQALSPHLRENQNTPKDVKGSKCDYFSVVYRCENVKSYFDRLDLNELDKERLTRIKNLKVIQEELFKLQRYSWYKISSKRVKELVSLADREASEALEKMKNKSVSKDSEMLLVLHYFTAQGIRKTLEQSLLIPHTELL